MKIINIIIFFIITSVFLTSAFALTPEEVPGIYKAAGIKGGLIIHIGCEDGKTTTALFGGESYIVQGLDKNEKNITTARKYINSKNIYGKVSIEKFEKKTLPYADNIISLLIIEAGQNIPEQEIKRVLSPRGVVLLKGSDLTVKNWKIDIKGNWNAYRKPVPDNIDEWTHYFHGPDNNAVAKETLIGLPQHMQWKAYPDWGRHHNTAQGIEAVVSTKGRIFYILDEAEGSIGDSLPEKWTLVARDAFNGVLLWKKPIKNFDYKFWATSAHSEGRMGYPKQRHRRLVAVDEKVYVTLGLEAPVSVLDAASGKIIRTLKGTEFCAEIICYQNKLYLSMRRGKGEDAIYHVLSLDPATGKVFWKSGEYKGFPGKYPGLADLSLIVGNKYVMFQDAKETVCLALETGKELWRSTASYTVDETGQNENAKFSKKDKKSKKGKNKSRNKKDKKKKSKYKMGAYCTFVYHDDIVYLLNPFASPNLSAVSAKSGKTIWQEHKFINVYGTSSILFIAQGLLWVFEDKNTLEALDLKTGKNKRTIDVKKAVDATGGHIRCYPEKATENTLWTTIGGKPQQIVDLNDGKIYSMPWLRGACRIGILLCNGLIYMTPHPCMCHLKVKVKGFLSLSSSRQEKADNNDECSRLEKGPGFGKTLTGKITSNDWPMLRHDPSRGDAASTTIGNSIKMSWEAKIQGKLTQPVIAGGMVYVVSIENHKLYAFDANTGKQVWTFHGGGRIDSPPTYYNGKILFGCSDGRAYCVSAKTGALVWKFRVVPENRNIISQGQLESVWPIHGSLLINKEKVVVVAGRTSYLDGGIFITLLDPDTGKVFKEKNINTTGMEFPDDPVPGLLPDILVVDKKVVYMYFSQITLNGSEIKVEDNSTKESGGPGKAIKVKQASMFLTASGGMLYDGFFHRSGLLFGKSWGQLMAVDKDTTYSIRLFPDWNKHNGPPFTHGEDKFQLIAEDPATGKKKWSVDVSLVTKAMILAGDKIILGGGSEAVDPEDPWKSYEGRGAGKLFVLSREDGSPLEEHEISSIPVYDGISAANSKLYISLKNGNLQCWK